MGISVRGYCEENWAVISAFEYDDPYPFTNIFSGTTTARWDSDLIGFTGSYKQIEDSWDEWMWKFGQLLSRLAASVAFVQLDGYLGYYSWHLRPQNWNKHPPDPLFSGANWEIYDWAENDFLLSPEWQNSAWVREGGQVLPRWDKAAYVRQFSGT